MHYEDYSLLPTQKGYVCFTQLGSVDDVKSFMKFYSTLMEWHHQIEPPRDILVHDVQDYIREYVLKELSVD